MILLLLASILPTTTTADRLEAYISTRQPKARHYARQLAAVVIKEGKANKIRPAALLAIAWLESRLIPSKVSRTFDYGLWQLRVSDYRMPRAWDRLWRAGLLPAGMEGAPWALVPLRAKTRALRDIRTSAALAAVELAGVRAWCRRAGHRVSRWGRGKTHRHWIDRFGHHLTGARWPRRWYVRGLRREYKRIRLALKREK